MPSATASWVARGRRRTTRGGVADEALCYRRDRSNRRGSNIGHVDLIVNLGSDGGLLRAITRYVTGLSTLIAGLAGSVEGAAVGSRAITGNVAEFATGVALHRLSLTIAGEMVGTAALVAGSGARAASETATAKIAAGIAAAPHGGATTHGSGADGIGASTSQMAGLAAVVTAPGSGVTGQAQSRAVSLNVTKALAVIALLCLSGARKRAAVGLVAGLLAVVAKALRGRADLGIVADVATLVASTTGERRHDDVLD